MPDTGSHHIPSAKARAGPPRTSSKDNFMTWFRIDDSFYDHPKVFDAPDCAVALWARAGAWAARNLTDGFVPSGMPARLCDDPDAAVRELTRRGLWKRTSGGFRFHDWTEYQPTKEEAIAGRNGMSSGGALGNHRRWHLGSGKRNASCRYCIGSSAPDGPDENDSAGNQTETQKPVGSESGFVRHPQADPASISSPDRGDRQKPDRGTDRPPDRVPDAVPESGANPPSRPVPKDLLGGALSDLPTTARAQPQGPPPPTCPEHQGMAEPPNCGRCADARRVRERWDLADSERRRTASKCRSHRGQPAGNCALCRSEALAAEETS